MAGITLAFEDEPNSADDSLIVTPRFSKFELVNQWKKVLKDFSQTEPLAGAYLEGTQLERGDFLKVPFTVRVLFKGDQKFQHTQFTQNGAYPRAFKNYLETVLQAHVDLLFDYQGGTESDGTASPTQAINPYLAFSPAAIFEKDVEKEPILKTLTNLFATTWIHTRTAPKKVVFEEDSENALDDEIDPDK